MQSKASFTTYNKSQVITPPTAFRLTVGKLRFFGIFVPVDSRNSYCHWHSSLSVKATKTTVTTDDGFCLLLLELRLTAAAAAVTVICCCCCCFRLVFVFFIDIRNFVFYVVFVQFQFTNYNKYFKLRLLIFKHF